MKLNHQTTNNMEFSDKEYCIEVWGDYACFTRPELKVERVSYDVITPSAARAIFEAILFKKYAMRWQVTKIEVLNPIMWDSVRRNEVGATASIKTSGIYIEEQNANMDYSDGDFHYNTNDKHLIRQEWFFTKLQ